MKTKAKGKQARPAKRELFAELREGMAALAKSLIRGIVAEKRSR